MGSKILRNLKFLWIILRRIKEVFKKRRVGLIWEEIKGEEKSSKIFEIFWIFFTFILIIFLKISINLD